MNLQEIKYDAFISYRHCELDQFVAVNLHKELEAFRLPKVIEKQLRAKGITKKKIERVFRDRDELPVTVLSDILGTIPYEILTSVSNRVKRIYFQD